MMPNEEEGRKDNRSIIDQKERKKILKKRYMEWSKMAGYIYVDREVFPEERIGLGLEVRRPHRRRRRHHAMSVESPRQAAGESESRF
jgi:hypothetical protein